MGRATGGVDVVSFIYQTSAGSWTYDGIRYPHSVKAKSILLYRRLYLQNPGYKFKLPAVFPFLDLGASVVQSPVVCLLFFCVDGGGVFLA